MHSSTVRRLTITFDTFSSFSLHSEKKNYNSRTTLKCYHIHNSLHIVWFCNLEKYVYSTCNHCVCVRLRARVCISDDIWDIFVDNGQDKLIINVLGEFNDHEWRHENCVTGNICSAVGESSGWRHIHNTFTRTGSYLCNVTSGSYKCVFLGWELRVT